MHISDLQLPRVPWDIETGAQDIDAIKRIVGEFKPENVKLGNKKTPEAIEAAIEEARKNYEPNLLDIGPLKPLLGRVSAIGFKDINGKTVIIDALSNERAAIKEWFAYMEHNPFLFYGWNTFGFDLKFLRQRAILLGVNIPLSLYDMTGYRPRWERNVDLMLEYAGGWGGPQDYFQLDHVARAFGHAGKNGNGAEFHKLWSSGVPELREQARMYLSNDLDMTEFTGNNILNIYTLPVSFQNVPPQVEEDEIPM